jgi:16S rRNA (cytosine967-C5)-methyltransferase
MARGDDPCRRLAWQILQEIQRSGGFADSILDQIFSERSDLNPRDRSFIHEMVIGVLRWKSRLDLEIRKASRDPRRQIDPRLLQLLRLGAYQILYLDRVPDAAAVNESVSLARAHFHDEKIAKFVNALLRQIARQKNQETLPPLEESPVAHIAQATAHPEWMVRRWIRDFGLESTLLLCQSNNLRPPHTIRVNTLKISREKLQKKFEDLGIEAHPTPYAPEGLILGEGFHPLGDPLFAQGMYFIQDESSQIVSHIVNPRAGERILDACAAPGGKTTHLAQLMNNHGHIIGIDRYRSKLRRLQENLSRMGISIISPIVADALGPLPFPKVPFLDRILVDAPCTGLGILHRHPEIKWRRKPQDPRRLQETQLGVLRNVASYLKPGGILVYSTCTLTPEENHEVVESFLKEHPDFQQENLRDLGMEEFGPLIDAKGFFRTYPDRVKPQDGYRMDGFFAARMRRML